MKDRMIVGCDPGFEGALALLCGRHVLDIVDMPVTERPTKKKPRFTEDGSIIRGKGTRKELDRPRLAQVLRDWHGLFGVSEFAIERVGSRPQQGVASTFRFGQNAESPEAMAIGIGYGTIYLVEPSRWKKALGCLSLKSTSVREAKARLTGIDEYLTLKKHNDRAEAALIGLAAQLGYGRVR